MMAKIHCGTILLLLVVVVVSQHVNTSDLVKLPSQHGGIKLRSNNNTDTKKKKIHRVTPGVMLHQVFIKEPTKGGYKNICSGGLIANNKILTSADCVAKKANFCQKMCKKTPVRSLTSLYAVAGNVVDKTKYKKNGASTEQWRKLSRARIAPGFNFPKNDIAVVFTYDPFKKGKYVRFLPYATKDMNYADTVECFDSSFIKEGQEYGFYLKVVHLRSKSQCKKLHGENMDDFLCIDDGLAGSLSINRGSPLFCGKTGDPKDRDGIILGVLSGYRKKGKEWIPYYTRVSKHSAFVKKASRNVPLLNIVWIPLIMSNFGSYFV